MIVSGRHIPQDKFGRVYWGPRTWREVVDKVRDIEKTAPTRVYFLTSLTRLADQLQEAGYVGLSRKIRAEYPVV